jgi:hypothetical protein
MEMQEPGLDLHEWETRWSELDEELEADPAGALPAACDLVEARLGDTDWSDDLEKTFRSARETADAVDRGDDVDPGDIGAAIDNLRDIRAALQPAAGG